jgi:hypothetical protein
LLLAIAAIGLAIVWARYALRMSENFRAWLEARPMETAIDLSQPGEISVPFRQTCSIAHGEGLYLQGDFDETRQEQQELLEGLSGVVVLVDAEGREIESLKISGTGAHFEDGKILLADFVPFRVGDYVARIRIESGASALAGREQTIYARYHLCGLEQLPARVASALALGAGIIGLVSAVCVLPGLLTHGFVRDASREGTARGHDTVPKSVTIPPTC